MSVKKVCDICGQSITNSRNTYHLKMLRTNASIISYYILPERYTYRLDLCEDCVDKIATIIRKTIREEDSLKALNKIMEEVGVRDYAEISRLSN